ncbi:MAG: DUF975 family protein [Tissierellaceae bacterium]|nr:DUF975 family protein [Tissierellaceae bacterium]
MWSRVELKNYAKDFLRKYYWKAFLVCLIFTILSGSGNSNGNDGEDSNIGFNVNFGPSWMYQHNIKIDLDSVLDSIGSEGIKGGVRLLGLFQSFMIGSTIFTFALILWIIRLFIGPLIEVGKNRFFLSGFKGDVSFKYLFSAFNRDEFWGVFKCMFITGLKNILWYFLLIIPGIVKSYEYRMVPYLLTTETNLTSSEAIGISRELTYGHKWDMFVLDLSFMGWYLLGALLFGLGAFFVTPYYESTIARLYNVLSGNDDGPNKYNIVYE